AIGGAQLGHDRVPAPGWHHREGEPLEWRRARRACVPHRYSETPEWAATGCAGRLIVRSADDHPVTGLEECVAGTEEGLRRLGARVVGDRDLDGLLPRVQRVPAENPGAAGVAVPGARKAAAPAAHEEDLSGVDARAADVGREVRGMRDLSVEQTA